jgi:hypothetical protein
LPWAETGWPTMEIGELPRSIALPTAVMVDRQLAGDEAAGEAGREHLSGVSSSLWGTGRKGVHRSGPPPPKNNAVRAEEGDNGSGIRRSMAVARVPKRDGASAATSWWCRLDWRRAGVACCRRRPCHNWNGRWLVLLAADSSRCSRRRWREPLGGHTARCCGDGFRTVTQAWRSDAGSASGRAGPDRGVGPVLDRGHAVGSRTRGGQVEGGP